MSSTRLLILGVVRIFQPVHGYDIRRELESWRVEDWAQVSYGSIYHAINRAVADGLLEVVSTGQVGRRPARTTYRLTAAGEAEYHRILREHWATVVTAHDPFSVAWSFLPDLDATEIVGGLRHRIAVGRAWIEEFEAGGVLDADTARHVHEILELGAVRARAEIDWAERMIAKVERGELP